MISHIVCHVSEGLDCDWSRCVMCRRSCVVIGHVVSCETRQNFIRQKQMNYICFRIKKSNKKEKRSCVVIGCVVSCVVGA